MLSRLYERMINDVPSDAPWLERLHNFLCPLVGHGSDFDPLLALMGQSRFALLGEASHGTQEFYRERIRITQRLITECGFTAVAVEADWPDAWRVNRYVRGVSDDPHADAALAGFQRFPAWMWRNTDVRDFVEWLREYNAGRSHSQQVGFYGIDLSHHGWVRAADDWDAPRQTQADSRWAARQLGGPVPPAGDRALSAALARQHRVAGVDRAAAAAACHRRNLPPRNRAAEPLLHTRLPQQFDAMIHLDETDALEPLDRFSAVSDEEVPDTYPAGI